MCSERIFTDFNNFTLWRGIYVCYSYTIKYLYDKLISTKDIGIEDLK